MRWSLRGCCSINLLAIFRLFWAAFRFFLRGLHQTSYTTPAKRSEKRPKEPENRLKLNALTVSKSSTMRLSHYSKNNPFCVFFAPFSNLFLAYLTKYVLRRGSKREQKIHQKLLFLNIPKQAEESGIWQGGFSKFSSSLVPCARTMVTRSRWKFWEASLSNSRFFSLFRYSRIVSSNLLIICCFLLNQFLNIYLCIRLIINKIRITNEMTTITEKRQSLWEIRSASPPNWSPRKIHKPR
jgi:hypothetical protein